MASSAVPLMQLVDFALCTPEVGTVNFSILHTALAVIIKQMGLNNVNIRFKGADATKFENFKSFVGDDNTAKLPEFDITTPASDTSGDKKGESDEGAEKTEQLTTSPASKENTQSVPKKESTEVTEHEGDAVESGELAARLSAIEKTVENLVMMMENLKNEFENAQSHLPAQGNETTSEDAADSEPSVQEGRTVKWQMDGNSQLEEFVQLKTTVQQLSEKVQSMSGAAQVHESVKSIPEIQELISKTNEIKRVLHMFSETGSQSESEKKQNVLNRLNTMDTVIQTHDKQLNTVIEFIQKHSDNLQLTGATSEHKEIDQATTSKQSAQSMEKMSIANVNSLQMMIASHGEDIMYLTSRVQRLEEELMCLEKIVNKQLKDQEERDMEHNSMIEQIQVLRTTKAEKNETEDILASKADKFQVHTKVSHSSFDNFAEELKTVISNIFEKIKFHEDTFNNESNVLFSTIETKVDRNELMPIVEYVNEHLKQLQEKVMVLATLKKLEEAAGAKRKYLKNINCISCNNEVVMKQEMDSETKQPEHTVKPQSASSAHHNVRQKHVQQKSDEDGHGVKRYCGGSHTITTAKQRVTRVGHFLDQFGPIITTLSKTGTPLPRSR